VATIAATLVAESLDMTSNKRTASGAVNRRALRRLIHSGCIVLLAGTVIVQSEEMTIRSGSKTIVIQSGESSPRTITSGDFSSEMLAAHNNIRVKINLPPLQWSGKLAAYSQKWANSLITKDRAGHNSKSPYGENILVTSLGSTPSMTVAEWASESQDYTYRNNACNGDCGHYTQLVWRSTRQVGCAMAHNSQREIWVCSYDPPGNFNGEWPY
jgi:pathogenesis-related protein 1